MGSTSKIKFGLGPFDLTFYRLTKINGKIVRFMTPLPPGELCKGEEQAMKDWLENYHPVRQRTVTSETTKDKAGTLPPAVYSNANPKATTRVFFPDDQVEQTPTASSEMRSVVSDVSVLSFVSDATVPQLTLASTVAADFAGAGVRDRFGWQWRWCWYWVRRTGY